jgi:hypothetical protein
VREDVMGAGGVIYHNELVDPGKDEITLVAAGLDLVDFADALVYVAGKSAKPSALR